MLSDDHAGTGPSNGTARVVTNGTALSQRTSLNGATRHGSAGLNGSSQNGGKSAATASQGSYMKLDKGEMTRLLIQALSNLGYQEAAESVNRQSGIELENPTVAAFRQAVLSGDWVRAEEILDHATVDGGDQTHGNGLVLSPTANKNSMKFWLRKQKYLELLEQRDHGQALGVLRNELAPLCPDKVLHTMASLIMSQSPEDMKTKARWDGAKGESRQQLLSNLSKNVSASVMLPEHRLATLLREVQHHQVNTCMYHTDESLPSLYTNHYCPPSRFPTQVVRELDKHTGEVWQVQFSHDGTKLASCGKDFFVVIWSVPEFEVIHKLDVVKYDPAHPAPGVGAVAWSPDDTMLVTCGRDHHARLWDVATGTQRTQYEAFGEPVTSCVWAPDGQSIMLGSMDKERALSQWSLDGVRLYNWTTKHRIEDMAMSPHGRWLVGMAYGNKLLVFNFETKELESELELDARPTSISIGRQEPDFLLVNQDNGEAKQIHIPTGGLLLRYKGHTGGLCQIRSSLGGANESYVVSGSDDGSVIMWHRWTSHEIFRQKAHTPRTNGVWWNPQNHCMFASCGDDHKIKIWSNEETNRNLPSPQVVDHDVSEANGNDVSPSNVVSPFPRLR